MIASRIDGEAPDQFDGQLFVNPTTEQIAAGTLNVVVAGTADAILMVEAGSREVSEETIVSALLLGQEQIGKLVELQLRLRDAAGAPRACRRPSKCSRGVATCC